MPKAAKHSAPVGGACRAITGPTLISGCRAGAAGGALAPRLSIPVRIRQLKATTGIAAWRSMREDMCVYSLLPISNPSGIIFFGMLFLISKNAGEHTPVTIVRKDFHLDELLRGNGDSLIGYGV